MKIIKTKLAPAAIGPYSQAIEVNKILYTSGQLGINPVTNQMGAGIVEQTQNYLNNIEGILNEADYKKKHY